MKLLLRAVTITIALFIICGLVYPLAMTGISQLLFHHEANGSIMENNGKQIGSELLGQSFTDSRFFHGRISAVNYNTYNSKDKTAYSGPGSGSANLAPSNPELVKRVKKDIDAFLKANPEVRKEDIPTDLLTSSGSGLDPDISPEAARIQIPAISKATGISISDLEKIVEKYTTGRTLGIFGEPRFNVLKANIEISEKIK
ncbi:potassium-transporting ATPase subunit KdpC [Clostridium sp. BNL1100]|uniref:potassium-transporting ATPase subunit KdpC n=1 Tax=Clostridium sp. BNL1100 TaxID=755731 RepID=UPI00024A7E87|nr:potassium-transporting ATPase subunit KdpC [Clostridium sp. BNL1100]AEY68037.1 K+-transporting ATPase, C subunit [Clostridium sp. BNL1100]